MFEFSSAHMVQRCCSNVSPCSYPDGHTEIPFCVATISASDSLWKYEMLSAEYSIRMNVPRQKNDSISFCAPGKTSGNAGNAEKARAKARILFIKKLLTFIAASFLKNKVHREISGIHYFEVPPFFGAKKKAGAAAPASKQNSKKRAI